MKRTGIILITLLCALTGWAQTRKVQNRPYADQRKVHYGFLVGIHMQDYEFGNSGYVTPEGETWFADIGEYSPGFTVGVLGEFYLQKHLALRLIPTLEFGDKRVTFKEQLTDQKHNQTMKSCYISLPLDLKFSAERFNNYRPYLVAGVCPSYDLIRKRQKALLTKPFDVAVEVGLGCDFYLPFFKLIPELKFRFGLFNLLEKKRNDLTDLSLMKFTDSLDKVCARTISLCFYFE